MLPSLLHRRFFVLIWLVALCGCRLPWSSENSVPAIHAATKTSPSTGAAATTPASGAQSNHSATTAYQLPNPEPSQEEAMAEVLADLEEIGAIDPAAREALMEDLRAAKLSNWPLIVQSFRAALAYRQQLNARESADAVVAEAQPDRMPSQERSESGPPQLVEESISAARLSSRTIEKGESAGDRSAQTGPITPFPKANPSPGQQLAGLSAQNPLRAAAQQASGTATVDAPPEPRHGSSQADRPPRRVDRLGGGEDSAKSANAEVRPVAYVAGPPVALADPFESQPPEDSGPDAGAGESRHPSGQSWQEELGEAIGQLEAATANAPTTGEEVRTHAMLRMLYLVADRREDALRPIAGIAPAQQDYWSKQLFALATYLDENGPSDARRRATAAQAQLAEAVAILGELGSLSVHDLVFCSDVSGFGVYTPVPEARFSTGERVLLYAEVRNYRSVSTEKGYHTVLATSYAVLDVDGQRVAGGEFPEVKDDCRNRRHDFHIQYGVVLPSALRSGKYSLELIIQDVLANKIGRSRTDFEIK